MKRLTFDTEKNEKREALCPAWGKHFPFLSQWERNLPLRYLHDQAVRQAGDDLTGAGDASGVHADLIGAVGLADPGFAVMNHEGICAAVRGLKYILAVFGERIVADHRAVLRDQDTHAVFTAAEPLPKK